MAWVEFQRLRVLRALQGFRFWVFALGFQSLGIRAVGFPVQGLGFRLLGFRQPLQMGLAFFGA